MNIEKYHVGLFLIFAPVAVLMTIGLVVDPIKALIVFSIVVGALAYGSLLGWLLTGE